MVVAVVSQEMWQRAALVSQRQNSCDEELERAEVVLWWAVERQKEC